MAQRSVRKEVVFPMLPFSSHFFENPNQSLDQELECGRQLPYGQKSVYIFSVPILAS